MTLIKYLWFLSWYFTYVIVALLVDTALTWKYYYPQDNTICGYYLHLPYLSRKHAFKRNVYFLLYVIKWLSCSIFGHVSISHILSGNMLLAEMSMFIVYEKMTLTQLWWVLLMNAILNIKSWHLSHVMQCNIFNF